MPLVSPSNLEEPAVELHVCSLIYHSSQHGAQSIPADGDYHLVKFPYGGEETEDADNMHAEVRDGVSHPYPSDKESGLIWPAHEAHAELKALIYWKAGGATEYRDRFVRDPLDLSTGYDSTCTDHRAPTPGMQCYSKSWAIRVQPGTPIGLMVSHNSSSSIALDHAQFKLKYYL